MPRGHADISRSIWDFKRQWTMYSSNKDGIHSVDCRSWQNEPDNNKSDAAIVRNDAAGVRNHPAVAKNLRGVPFTEIARTKGSTIKRISNEKRLSSSCGDNRPNAGSLEESEHQLWERIINLTNVVEGLKNRVMMLERKNKSFGKLSRTLSGRRAKTHEFDASFAHRGGGIRTCIDLITIKRVALLQCVWLALCVGLFAGVAIALFLVAYSNENATWKSEKIDYTIDYADESANHQYDMPYVYIFFQIRLPNGETEDWLSHEQINNTLRELLASQDYFVNKTGFVYMDSMNAISNDVQSYSSEIEAVVGYDEGWVREDSVVGYFRLKPQNPDSGREWIQFCISIDTMKLTEVVPIIGFNIYIARALSDVSLGDVVDLHIEEFSDKIYQSFSIDYTEKVKHMMNNMNIEVVESSLTWWESRFMPNGSRNGFVDIHIATDRKVEH